jgi:hypothetical protein
LIPNIFTSVSGKSWCLRLFAPGRKVHKRGKIGNIKVTINLCPELRIEQESNHWNISYRRVQIFTPI